MARPTHYDDYVCRLPPASVALLERLRKPLEERTRACSEARGLRELDEFFTNAIQLPRIYEVRRISDEIRSAALISAVVDRSEGPVLVPLRTRWLSREVMFDVLRPRAEQAERLQPLATSGDVATSVEPPLAEASDREVVELLQTLVALEQQRTPRRDVFMFWLAVYSALFTTLGFFGYDRTVHALEALAHALGARVLP
jgi:hypothetical protein